jgi:site-specific recombinase XerD
MFLKPNDSIGGCAQKPPRSHPHPLHQRPEALLRLGRQTLTAITLHDVDAYIDHRRQDGHAIATVNRRLAAIRSVLQQISKPTQERRMKRD